MNALETLMDTLEQSGGKKLPTAQLAQAAQASCPLNREELAVLCRCIAQCSEQLYEHYRALVDVFRAQAQRVCPDEATIRLAVSLGLLDDEEWLPRAKEQEG